MPFTMRELQSLVRAAVDTVAGPGDIPYNIIRQLPDLAITTLLELYMDARKVSKTMEEGNYHPASEGPKNPQKEENCLQCR